MGYVPYQSFGSKSQELRIALCFTGIASWACQSYAGRQARESEA